MNKNKNEKKVETSVRYNHSTTERTTTSCTVVKQHESHYIQTHTTRNLGERKFSFPPALPSLKPLSLSTASLRTPTLTIDAKPFTPNYQSPFQRRTGLYQSLRTPTTPTFAPPPRSTISSLSLTGNASPTFAPPPRPTISSLSLTGNASPTFAPPPRPTMSSSSLTVNASPAPLAAPYKASSLPDVHLNIPTYTFRGRPRGRVLIINNVKFIEDKNDRKGAENDQACLKDMFEKFGYKVVAEKNLTKKQMSNTIKTFRKNSSLKDIDICIVIMMSHGTNINENGVAVAGGYTEVIGVDNKSLPIDEVLDEFSIEKCQYLKGKPKIFFFQCCRGTQHETLARDAKPIVTYKSHADMLIAHSTLPGFASLRDEKRGSWYIQCIHKVFKEQAKKMDVESMLKIVDDDLSRQHPNFKQTSSYECRGFKRCYLLS